MKEVVVKKMELAIMTVTSPVILLFQVFKTKTYKIVIVKKYTKAETSMSHTGADIPAILSSSLVIMNKPGSFPTSTVVISLRLSCAYLIASAQYCPNSFGTIKLSRNQFENPGKYVRIYSKDALKMSNNTM